LADYRLRFGMFKGELLETNNVALRILNFDEPAHRGDLAPREDDLAVRRDGRRGRVDARRPAIECSSFLIQRLEGSVPPAPGDTGRPTPERADLASAYPRSAAGPPPRPQPAARPTAARRSRRQGGARFINAPIGNVKTPCGGLVLDLDDQVRAVVRLIFDKGAMIMRGSRVVRRAGRRGMLKGRVRRTCEHLTMAETGVLHVSDWLGWNSCCSWRERRLPTVLGVDRRLPGVDGLPNDVEE